MRPRLILALAVMMAFRAFAAEERPLFTGTDLSGWKQPHGTWAVVGGVTLAADNPQAFVATPGSGAFLNSPAGKTSDLFTEAEHGDCELHVEFCVPQGSNSGVYLMGRYEVQIFDS